MTEPHGSPVRIGANGAVVEGDSLLVVTYDDEAAGRHHNLPGGGVDRDEPIASTVRREVYEETGYRVSVGGLLGMVEYVPSAHDERYGPVHKLELVFSAERSGDVDAAVPSQPDPDQVDVEWLDLADLNDAPLFPPIGDRWFEVLDAGTTTVVDDW